jgi:hypothetical protein
MQNSVGKLDTTRLVELMQAVPRDAYGIQSRFSVVDVARYGWNDDRGLDKTGHGYTLINVYRYPGMYHQPIGYIPEGTHAGYYQGSRNGFASYSYVNFPSGSFSGQLSVSVWVKPVMFRSQSWHPTLPDYRQIFFSLEADSMKGYMYVYAYKGGVYLRARAEGYPECQSTPLGYDTFESLNPGGGYIKSAVGVPYADVVNTGPTPWVPKAYHLDKPFRFIEVSSEFEDPDAAIAGETAGLSTISVSIDGVLTLSVTGCMLDSTLYRKLQVMAATNVQFGNKISACMVDDLWIRNKVPIGQM